MSVVVNTSVSGGGGGGGGGAPINSPAFTGVPTAPTNATATDATTQIATDAFVQNAIAAASSVIAGSVFATVFTPAPASSTRFVLASVTIPAGYPKPTGFIDVYATWTKSGTVDTIIPAIAFSPVGSGTVLGNASQMTTVAQQGASFFRIWGNGVDNTSVIWSRGSQNTPFTNVQASQNDTTVALNTAVPWTLNQIVTNGATETVAGTRLYVNLNPVAGATTGSGGATQPFTTITYSTTPTITYVNGANYDLTLSASTIASWTEVGLTSGVSWTMVVRQDGTGGWSVPAWPTSWAFQSPGGAGPTIPVTATTGYTVLAGVYHPTLAKTLVSFVQQS